MSWVTNRPPTELIFAQTADGTTLSNSATQTNIELNSATSPGPILQAGFWGPADGLSRSLRFVARGIMSMPAASMPTLVMSIGYGATPTLLCSTPAVTPVASLANSFWELEIESTVATLGTSGVVTSAGVFTYSVSTTSTTAMAAIACPQNTATWTATVDLTVQAALHCVAKFGTGVASSSITCKQFYVYGLN